MMAKIANLIESARGDRKIDLLLMNARMINVYSGEIETVHIAINSGHIVGFGSYDAESVIDLNNRFVAPGLIDAHVHIESAMSSVPEFVKAIVARGTTAVIADPHEIANVLGIAGIRYMIETSRDLPTTVFFAMPSCVPATHLETSGAVISSDDMKDLMAEDRIVALAEMMNFPGVIHEDPEVLKKIETAVKHRKVIDGHAPGVSGRDLFAYAGAGVASDHECTTVDEAREKLNVGMHIMIREGTGAKNLESLLPLVTPKNARRIMWCTDDRHPHDLLDAGHIDYIVRRAIQSGLDPVTAIQMATINPAEYFGLNNMGAIAPGKRADLIIFDDIHDPRIRRVYSRGILVAEDGETKMDIRTADHEPLPAGLIVDTGKVDFSIPATTENIRVIDIIPHQLVTRSLVEPASIVDGVAVSSPDRDILKIAVIERHTGSTGMSKAFVRGFGLKEGALASSVAHDSHNIIVVGCSDEDMAVALQTVVNMKGGLTVACNGESIADLPLPIAGIMSNRPVEHVRKRLDALGHAAHDLGSRLTDPFMTLSFLALPVIPELKITDKGLIDVNRFETVSLFV
jgi:adenine deaminase